jgi:hypothetical protein
MGATSTILLLDIDAHGRVAEALRDWSEHGVVAPLWADALTRAGERRPAARDRANVRAGTGHLPLVDGSLDEDTRGAIEVLVLEATRGDGVAIGNARSIVVDAEDAIPALEGTWEASMDGRAPASRLGQLLLALDGGLRLFNRGDGGFGEGLCGMLDSSDTSALVALLERAGRSAPHVASCVEIRERMAHDDAPCLFAVHAMARLAVSHGLGMLHGRDLRLAHLGAWRAGVFSR